MVLAMFLANAVFDIAVAHVAYRMAEKVAGQHQWGDPTFYPWAWPTDVLFRPLGDYGAMLARRVLEWRYGLTALPLLVILYFTWTRERAGEAQLGLAVSLSAFALAAKIECWEMLSRLADVWTRY